MQLYVAHKNEEKSNSRVFTQTKPNIKDIDFFGAFNFFLNETEFKFYDIEVFENHILCHIDLKPFNRNWKTITTKNKKQTLSFKSLENMHEDNYWHLYTKKGIDYNLISYAELNNKTLISKYKNENKKVMTDYEKEFISALT